MSRARDRDEPQRPGRPGRPEDDQRARLRAELMALGDGLDVPGADGATMAERVMAQIVAEGVPVPVRARVGSLARIRVCFRRRLRMLVAALSGLLVVLVLTPPVRAAVVEWFDFGGVEVRWVPDAPDDRSGQEAGGPGCGVPLAMPEAVRRAGFRPVVPDELGPPSTVAVTGLPDGHSMVTLCWSEGRRTIRLDAFESGLDPYFTKQVSTRPAWVKLNRADGADDGGGQAGKAAETGGAGRAGQEPGRSDGAWFAEPHLLEFMMTGEDGRRWIRTERTAGPTLLWMRDGHMTLRLEGVDSLERACAIAESTL
ncbi:hypothetical protein ACIRJR_07105 [Streptomyces sp. NPDC102402]|uniref:hypothetical protein n=1 Tax=Streptomyces sp. NPDC102402 TaxID=3366169 RepID=UPI00381C6729